MCENIAKSCYCSCNTAPTCVYAFPTYETGYSSSLERGSSKASVQQRVCLPPEKVRGLPVELATRKEPFKNYPKKSGRKIEPKIPSLQTTNADKTEKPIQVTRLDPDLAILENPVNGPAWTSRFCLKRLYSLLIREETATQLEERAWDLWAQYERTAKDVFVYDNVDIVANLVLALSTSIVRLPYSQALFSKIMQRLQRGVYMEQVLRKNYTSCLPSSMKGTVDIKRLAYLFTILGISIVEGHPLAQASISSILGVWLESVVEKRQGLQKLVGSNNKTTNNPRRCSLSSRLMKRSNKLTMMVPDGMLIAALEKSLLPRIIVKYFTDGSHTEGYISILSLLKYCCDASPVIRSRLFSIPALDPILLKLAMVDPTNRILITTSEFIYSYFGLNSEDPPLRRDAAEMASANPTMVPILEKDSFQVLLTRFAQQLDHCTSKSLLNTRNDTAFFICLIGERIPASGEYFEGFGQLIASIVSSAIVNMKDVGAVYLIDSTLEDLELLQYLMFMLKYIVEAGCGNALIEDYNTVAVLLRMIIGPCHLTTTPSGGNVFIGGEGERGNDLENAAWTTIQAIAKHCPLSLLTPHGVPSLLTFLNGFGQAGNGDQRILAMCLHTIRVLLTTPEEDSCVSNEVMGYLKQRDGMAIFLNILKQVTKENFDGLEETVVSNVLYCCAALAVNNNNDHSQKKEFLDLEGVSILMRLMRHLICHSADKRHMNPVIQMALAECIGCCIAYYPQALEEFLAVEGLFKLLDILELSAGPAAPVHIMNCILQLCDYPRCLDQLLYWHRPMKRANQRIVFGQAYEDDLARSNWIDSKYDGPKSDDILQEVRPRSDQTLFSMLCLLWKEEEDRFEVLRDPEGCIESITHPFMSKFARTYDKVSAEEKGVSRSCLDMSLSLRPKIFLLIKRIVEVTKTEATLFDGLSPGNQVIMQAIINFVDLKKSEIYLEMIDDLAADSEEDAYRIAQIFRNTLATVLETQRFLLRRSNEKEEINENEFYSFINQCRLQDHLMAVKEVEFLARTTNYPFLVEKRLWQKSELEGAMQELDNAFTKNSRIHRVSDGQLNITAWPYRTRQLISEPKASHEDAALENYDDNDDYNFPIEHEDPTINAQIDDEQVDQDEMLVGEGESESQIDSVVNVNTAPSGLFTSIALTETVTPEPLEGGFYQVCPNRLREALARLSSYRHKHEKWIRLAEQDDENYWKVRTKWKKEWYPLNFEERERQC